MDPVLVALSTRCPKLSDGARMTLLEILLHYPKTIPSLTKLAKLRNVWKSTIQLHMKELSEAKIVQFIESHDGARRFKFNLDQLAMLNGLKNAEDADESWIAAADFGFVRPSNKVIERNTLAALTTDPKTWTPSQWEEYFKIAGARHGIKKVTDYRIKTVTLVRHYGATMVKDAIDHFARYHTNMNELYAAHAFHDRFKYILASLKA